MKTIARLENPIQEYAWGSRTAIAGLLGEASPSPRPQAELWMGAHPRAPSRVCLGKNSPTLGEWIERDPVRLLGPEVAERFGGRLPFLFKLLAAARPLSIQAHPDERQAAEGFARENALGLAPDDPRRCYRDPSPKPELLCALAPFVALRGFRPVAEIRRLLGRLADPTLRRLLGAPDATEPGAVLRALLAGLLSLAENERTGALAEAVERSERFADEDPAFDWVARLARAYPGDIGALAPTFLQLVRLEPGEAMFVPARELHAHLEGFAVELMANSDNVLRGGLTTKHVDAAELLAVLAFREGQAERIVPTGDPEGRRVYPTPAQEFALSRLEIRRPSRFLGRGIEILLCTEGEVRVAPEAADGGEAVSLARGASCVVAHAARGYRIEGSGALYAASVPARTPIG